MFLFSFNVSAQEYYSEYGTYSEWQNNYVESSNTVDVQSKRMYKYYNEEYIGKYFIEGENTSDYPNKNDDNYYYTDFSLYSEIMPLSKPNRVIESKKVYTYKERNPVRYIKINDIAGPNGKVNFSEITIRNLSGKKINYLYICVDCSDNFLTYIKNGIQNENNSYIRNGGEILLDLMGYYRFDEFQLEVSIYDDTDEYKSFDVHFYNEIDGNVIMETEFADDYNCIDEYDVPTYIIDFLNMTYYDIEWTEVKQTEEYIENSFTVEVIKEDTYYRFKDKYINYYYMYREYSDFQDGPTDMYPCESEEYINVYRYRTRDYISIDDEIIINNNEDSLSNYISSSTNYDVIGNIDLKHNGIYNITIKTYFIEFNISVEISIEQNDLIERYNKLLNDYNELLERYHNLEERIIILQTENINILNDNERLTKDYNTLLEKYLEIKSLYEELEINYSENENIQNNYNILLNEYSLLEERLINIEKLNIINKQEYDNLIFEYQKLQTNYDTLVNINNHNIINYNLLKEQYDILLDSYEKISNDLERYSNDISNNEIEYDNLNKLYLDLLNKYDNLENVLNEYKLEYEKLLKIKENYDIIFALKNEELENLIKERETKEKEYQDILILYEKIKIDFENLNEDNIEMYNQMIEEINNYKIKINELTGELEICDKKISLKEEEKNKITKEFENQLINLKISHSNTNSIVENKDSIKNYNYLIPIITLVIIVFLLVGFFIKKYYYDK